MNIIFGSKTNITSYMIIVSTKYISSWIRVRCVFAWIYLKNSREVPMCIENCIERDEQRFLCKFLLSVKTFPLQIKSNILIIRVFCSSASLSIYCEALIVSDSVFILYSHLNNELCSTLKAISLN